MSKDVDHLLSFSKIDERARANLLLGNGFSIGVHSQFAYSSLLQFPVSERLISPKDNQLFSRFGTSDFEVLMRRLSQTAQVNEILGLDHKVPQERYEAIRNALVESIRHVHPFYEGIEYSWLQAVAAQLRTYNCIFTTNYDLLLYWILGSVEFRGFTDFFWSKNLVFDSFNVDNWFGSVEIYYLHGALFIFSGAANVYKVRRSTINKLQDHIRAEIMGGKQPLFISEGGSEDKRAAINRSSYLSFALRQFRSIKPGLVIYGSSLNQSSDGHILQAINENRELEVVAVSIYTSGKSDDDIKDTLADYTAKLRQFSRRGQLQFFDHSTAPFLYSHYDMFDSEEEYPLEESLSF